MRLGKRGGCEAESEERKKVRATPWARSEARTAYLDGDARVLGRAEGIFASTPTASIFFRCGRSSSPADRLKFNKLVFKAVFLIGRLLTHSNLHNCLRQYGAII